jgi:hypothetical protein
LPYLKEAEHPAMLPVWFELAIIEREPEDGLVNEAPEYDPPLG